MTVRVSRPELTDYTCKRESLRSLLRVRKRSQKFPCKYPSFFIGWNFNICQDMKQNWWKRPPWLIQTCQDLLGLAAKFARFSTDWKCDAQIRSREINLPFLWSHNPNPLDNPKGLLPVCQGAQGNLDCRWVRGSWTRAQAPHCGWRVTVERGLFLTDHGMEEGSWDPALGRQDYTQVKAWSLECIHHCFIVFHLKIQMQRSIY